MGVHGREHAAAGRSRDLRALTEAERLEDERHTAHYGGLTPDEFVPFRLNIVGGQVLDGFEHAALAETTACGLPTDATFLMRHTFDAGSSNACPSCVAALGA